MKNWSDYFSRWLCQYFCFWIQIEYFQRWGRLGYATNDVKPCILNKLWLIFGVIVFFLSLSPVASLNANTIKLLMLDINQYHIYKRGFAIRFPITRDSCTWNMTFFSLPDRQTGKTGRKSLYDDIINVHF